MPTKGQRTGTAAVASSPVAMAEVTRQKRSRQRRRKALAYYATLTLLSVGLIFLGTGWYYYTAYQKPVAPGSQAEQPITIPAGAHSRRIATILHEKGLIHHPLMFRLFVRWRGLDGRLQAGPYMLGPGLTLDEIVTKMVAGQVVTRQFTVPEGLTVAQIMTVLAQADLAPREELVAAAAAVAVDWPYLPQGGTGLPQPLEGYLFPDTYRLASDAQPRQIIELMLGRFETIFDAPWQARADELGLTVHEIVTLASIVEREARVAAERPIIAAVFHNRLRLHMKLDADPTVIYAVAWDRPDNGAYTLSRADLRVESPYNTYQYRGLPPGPIASPGAAAIEAVLHPAAVDYLYFVAKFDGTGAHVFAKTYAEHRRNVRKYRDGR